MRLREQDQQSMCFPFECRSVQVSSQQDCIEEPTEFPFDPIKEQQSTIAIFNIEAAEIKLTAIRKGWVEVYQLHHPSHHSLLPQDIYSYIPLLLPPSLLLLLLLPFDHVFKLIIL